MDMHAALPIDMLLGPVPQLACPPKCCSLPCPQALVMAQLAEALHLPPARLETVSVLAGSVVLTAKASAPPQGVASTANHARELHGKHLGGVTALT